jgi:ABC-type antimicrobial peptide transport system permease subunit
MALGATRRDVSGLIVTEGLRLAGAGLAIGLALALVVARLMASILYGIGPFDPVTFALVLGIFLAVAILASLLPASRAAPFHGHRHAVDLVAGGPDAREVTPAPS